MGDRAMGTSAQGSVSDVISVDASGNWVTWFEGGRKTSRGLVCKMKKEGIWITWHDNGQKSSEGEYHKGLRKGHWRTWHENGKLLAESFFRAGKPHGSGVFWHSTGQMLGQVQFQRGHLHGMCCYWHRDGRVDTDRSGFYWHGELRKLLIEQGLHQPIGDPDRSADPTPTAEEPADPQKTHPSEAP